MPEELPCKDKLVFESKDQAQAIATTAEWQHGTKLKVYICQHCGLLHLASDFDD